MTIDIKNALTAHLKQFNTAPFLFVGSGLSRRYLGLETWFALLEKFTLDTGKSFDYYKSGANSYAPKIASILAIDYREMWFREEQFAVNRAAQTAQIKDISSPLKIEIASYICQKSLLLDDPTCNTEIGLLKNSVVDGIITTNWDMLIETLFPSFTAYVGQDKLLFSQQQSVAEIYKIHGCCTDPNSLVLTNEDYDYFIKRNPYLAAKLLSVFIEHPVIFLGYSISDTHIVQILESIVTCLTTENINKLTDNLIFVEWDVKNQGDAFSRQAFMFGSKSLSFTVVRTKNYAPIYEALADKKRAIPARLLRQLKEQLYQLILTNDPREQMYVKDIDSVTDVSKIDVVFGIGVAKQVATAELGSVGYVEVDKNDVLKDVLSEAEDNKNFDARQLVTFTLPRWLRANPKTPWPIYKFLRQAGYNSENECTSSPDLPDIIKQAIQARGGSQQSLPSTSKLRKIADGGKPLAELEREETVQYVVQALLVMNETHINIDELKGFLQQNIHMLNEPGYKSNFRKLIRRYDYLKYRFLDIERGEQDQEHPILTIIVEGDEAETLPGLFSSS